MNNTKELEEQAAALLNQVSDRQKRVGFLGRRYALVNAASRAIPEDERKRALEELIRDIRAQIDIVE